jgi:hypothetical protein
MKRAVMFFAGFSVMLIAGMATAQMGGLLEEEPATVGALAAPDDVATPETVVTTTTVKVTTTTSESESAADKPGAGSAESELEPKPEPKPEPPADATPPEIVISTPSDGETFEQKEVLFQGVTEPGARVFAGEYEATVDGDGNWSIVLWLSPGRNVATMKAIDEAGNISKVSVTVELAGGDAKDDKPKDDKPKDDKPKDDKPKDDKPKDDKPKGDDGKGDDGKGDDGKGDDGKGDGAVVGFSASQKRGSAAADEAYDYFFGTGRHGLVIEASSPYGSGRVEVGKTGHWDMKVFFTGAPLGSTFDVVIASSDGDRKVLQFTITGGEG